MIFQSVRCDWCKFDVLDTTEYPDSWVQVVQGGETVGSFCSRSCVVGLVGRNVPGVRLLPVGIHERDPELLELVALGHSNKEIATLIGNAESTVKNRLSEIFAALGVDDRLQVLLAAHALGLLNLPRLAEQFYADRGTVTPTNVVRLPSAGVRRAA